MEKIDILTMEQFSTDEIMEILNDAFLFKTKFKDWQFSKTRLIANLFFEPSTRTHYSFSSAQMQLGMKIIDFAPESSSVKKGETFHDTCRLFQEIGMDALVIRDIKDKYYDDLRDLNIPIINGGDGKGNHPTQSLLDLMTIYEEFERFEGLNMLVVGDIKHSRVAHSNIGVFERLGGNCKVSGSREWMDSEYNYIDLDEGLKWADIAMFLRIQRERHDDLIDLEGKTYLECYGLTNDRLNTMKDNAIILHPAPFNRGVELDDSIPECDKSRIWKQMENGVYVRKAVIKKVIGESFE